MGSPTNRVAVYSLSDVSIIFGGFPLEDGRADETIKIEPAGEAFTDEKGADGLVIRSKTNETRWNITLTLKAASNNNDILSGIHIADVNAEGGAGVAPILVKDNGGSSIFASAHCWIKTPAATTHGNQRPDSVWTMVAVANPAQAFHGGN